MSINLSRQKRDSLLSKISAIRTRIAAGPQDEEAGRLLTYLSDLEKEVNGKKYGLVFEEHQEAVDEVLAGHTPVLTEEKELRIAHGGEWNFLLEGDNLAALQLLEKTHRGRIDVIYIDPPYNTGNKDFIYDDEFVGSEDLFRHSKWLSFMQKRLALLYELLSPEGYICISIDDHEQPDMRLLCDRIFGESNFIACMARRTKSSGKTTSHISSNHDYVLLYAKNIDSVAIAGIPHIDKGFRYEDAYVETRGKYKLNQTLDYDSLSYSDSLDYPIEIDGRTFYPGSDPEKYRQRKNGDHQRADWAWRWSRELFEFGYQNGFIVVKEKRDGSARIYTKTYLNASIGRNSRGEYEVVCTERKKPLSTLDLLDPAFSNDNAKKDLKKLFDGFAFDYPKPLSLLTRLLQICCQRDALVLDCFAGSGTTGHAVMRLNAGDGGRRRFILCTNNENEICRNVTYERIRRAIESEDGKASLKYCRVGFVPTGGRLYYEYLDELLPHVRELIELEHGASLDEHGEIAAALTDEELEDFTASPEALDRCRTLYLGCNVLLNGEQEALLREKEISVRIVPGHYYREWED